MRGRDVPLRTSPLTSLSPAHPTSALVHHTLYVYTYSLAAIRISVPCPLTVAIVIGHGPTVPFREPNTAALAEHDRPPVLAPNYYLKRCLPRTQLSGYVYASLAGRKGVPVMRQ